MNSVVIEETYTALIGGPEGVPEDIELLDLAVLIANDEGEVVYQKEAGAAATVEEIEEPGWEYAGQGRYRFSFVPDGPATGIGYWDYILDHEAFSAHERIEVRATATTLPTPPAAGTSYATNAAAAAYLGIEESALPSDIARLLVRASELVDYATHGNIDDDDDDHLDAAQRAVCAIVESWIENGEDEVVGSSIRSYSIGKTSFTFGGSGGSSAQSGDAPLCKRAHQILATAGLLYAAGRVR